MRLACIVAISENDVIGANGALPWRLPSDLRRFRRLTIGHPIIMGRKTWESIGRPLPGRHSIILTRQRAYAPAGVADSPEQVSVAGSLDEALAIAAAADEVFVIGGEAVFRTALPRADRLCVTRVHAELDGDVRFPAAWLDGWRLVSSERHEADEQNDHPYSFLDYERRD